MDAEPVTLAPPRRLPEGAGNPLLWNERWADPALRALGRWFTIHDLPDQVAADAVATVWSFYSYTVVPAWFGYPEMGLSAKQDGEAAQFWLHLPSLATRAKADDHIGPEQLRSALERDFGLTPIPGVAPHLEVVESPDDLEDAVRRICAEEERTFLGVYVDDLREEPTRVTNPTRLDTWLAAPNENFHGRRPLDVLGDPGQDFRLRNVIIQVTYSLVG